MGDMALVIGTDPTIREDARAGKLGAAAVVFYGVLCVIAVFVAAFFWMNGDGRLAAVLGIGSLVVPVTAGFFVAEFVHQRAGALAFVLTAALVVGVAGASAYSDSEEYFAEREYFHATDGEVHSIGDDAREFLRDLTD